MFAFVCVCASHKQEYVCPKREREILSVIFVLYCYVVLKFRRVSRISADKYCYPFCSVLSVKDFHVQSAEVQVQVQGKIMEGNRP